MKQCTKCRKRKPFSEFYKAGKGKSGIRAACKECVNSYSRKYHLTDQGKQVNNKANKKYYHAHKVERNEYRKRYYKTVIGCLRARFHCMRRRCANPKDIGYKYYGGRGIKCLFRSSDEFVDYVINVLKIDPRGLQIDRIDNNGHYEPSNIRFTTAKENSNNRRKNNEIQRC